MRKTCFFFDYVVPVGNNFFSGNTYATDPPKSEYDATMVAITDGAYYIVTEVDGIVYYVTAAGTLTRVKAEARAFIITKRSGGAFGTVGSRL